ncbi:MAG: phosphodiesterase [Clostridia bacterium]|nr:phosphodiesterase [Clostridia bacterium]MDD3832106.1 phosphodiesterase [Clostridia bacterium]
MSKTIFAGDIHGSTFYCRMLLDRMSSEKADKLVLLGDLYYHGIRNPLTKDYLPITVCQMLNEMADKLYVVQGNCDSQVDVTVSNFTFNDSGIIECAGKRVFVTHGHIYNSYNVPPGDYDILMYAHTHEGCIYRLQDIIVCNTGSVSMPRGDSKYSYACLSEHCIALKDLLTGEVIQSITL